MTYNFLLGYYVRLSKVEIRLTGSLTDPLTSCHIVHVWPPGGRSRGVWGLKGEAPGLRPPMLQDHGRADSRQGSDPEEDPQAAADLL